MESQDTIDLEVGTIERKKLGATVVVIKSYTIEKTPKKGAEYLVCLCQHPDSKELIKISKMKYEKNSKLTSTSLWVNRDAEKKLDKTSPSAIFVTQLGLTNLNQLTNHPCPTIMEDNGYLAFKCY